MKEEENEEVFGFVEAPTSPPYISIAPSVLSQERIEFKTLLKRQSQEGVESRR